MILIIGIFFIVIFSVLLKRAIKGPGHGIARFLLIPFLVDNAILWLSLEMGWTVLSNAALGLSTFMCFAIFIWFVLACFDIID